MIGAIAGDVIGSVFEGHNIKSTEFPLFSSNSRFTDDTVLTVAVAYSVLKSADYVESFKMFGLKYPNAGYGGFFIRWLLSDDSKPYNSWGNGSAMRVSSIGFALDSVEDVLKEAGKSAEVTHNHPEGIKGAQAVALAILMARQGSSKDEIHSNITASFFYDLDRTIEEIRPGYQFDVSCMGSVPEAIIAFLDSTDYESAVRKAISLGGDSDTQACIAGGIAEAYYKTVPSTIISDVKRILPENLREILARFEKDYPCCDTGELLKVNHSTSL